jgi:flagellar biosynthesis protein
MATEENKSDADQPSRRSSAAALKYRPPDDGAPRLVAKGTGEIAERILELARENNIPIHEDPDLLTVLSQLDLDKEIPSELYKPIAEILSFVYRVNERAKSDETSSTDRPAGPT